MLFFGVAGAVLFAIGFLAGIVALVLRFGFGIGFRPLLNLVETMVISGIALFGFGFVGEMVAGLREELVVSRSSPATPRPRLPHRRTARLHPGRRRPAGQRPMRVRVVFLTHNYPRFPGDVSGAFLATLASALIARGTQRTGAGAERRRRGGRTSAEWRIR